MCSGSKRKVSAAGVVMEGGTPKNDSVGPYRKFSLLLELSATNDVGNFKNAVEIEGHDLDEPGSWYGRKIGSKKMGFEERTPLMIASMFGSKDVVSYILETGSVDINWASGSDRATALHCAVFGGSPRSIEVVKLLIDSFADVYRVDSNGNRPVDVIAHCPSFSSKSKRKMLEKMLKGGDVEEVCVVSDGDISVERHEHEGLSPKASSDGSGSEKREYPVDPSLPDIKNGIYSTDEFRMFTFKIKPCCRAYSHDWTECPFVHPGENARRRDPRKYHYSCVPCPEFRKGSCPKGDACEYAHGIFECWLHPAQYRTRLCKDETNCTRRVCFFAHKPEELRPLYASTGSAVPSPRSYSPGSASFDMALMSPLSLSGPSALMPSTSTPPMTPTGASSPMWQTQLNATPPTLQLPRSRLKSGLRARDMDLETELRRQHLLDELAGLASPSSWKSSFPNGSVFASSVDQSGEFSRLGNRNMTNLDNVFGSMDPLMSSNQLQSPTNMQMRQSLNQQLRPSYSSGLSSSPARPSSFAVDPPGSPIPNSRAAAFAKRSQSFIDRSGIPMPSHLSDWGSPSGKLDWGIQGEELNKLRKSASFGYRNHNNNSNNKVSETPTTVTDEADISWVQSIVKDGPSAKRQPYHLNSGSAEKIPLWVEQMYMEQEQMVA